MKGGIKGILKIAAPLLMATAFMIYPAKEFIKSSHLAGSGMEAEGEIVKYEPEILGGGGGRRFIEDRYIISYGGARKKVLLGTRQAEINEGFEKMISNPPRKTGDKVIIFYLPADADLMRVDPASITTFSIYNGHSDAALLYLMKIIAILLYISALLMFKSRKKDNV